MTKQFTLMTMFALLSLFGNAQIPQGFNFQAVARDAQGELITDTSIEVIVKIRFGSESGEVLWEELHKTTTNEYGMFSLVVCGDDNLRIGGSIPIVTAIPWLAGNHYIDLQIDAAGRGFVELGATPLRAVPYSMASSSVIQNTGSLEIQPKEVVTAGEPLFIVRRQDGYPIFAVYEDGVEVYTDITEGDKGLKGGFAVGGYNTGKKGIGQAIMTVTPDSTRIYVNELTQKGVKGGFAVGGYNTGKVGSGQTYMSVSPDSTRIYVNDIPGKSLKGGFAVGGYNTGKKSVPQEYLRVTQDSTRVYVNSRPDGKGLKGGFAVGGYNTGKAGDEAFMTLQFDNYFIGHRSGSNISSGIFNSTLGFESGANITEGEGNAFLGYQSGFGNTTGSGNLFLGYQSGFDNQEGSYNTFLGYRAGYLNRSGTSNTFLGSFTGNSNISGNSNTFVGDSVGFSNTDGYSNTIMGTRAGIRNRTGFSNVMLGNQAGYSNDDGSWNVFIGHLSGHANINAGSNVFIGTETGFNSVNGWNNIYIGTETGHKNSDGEGNLFMGYQSGHFNEHGTRNVFLGNRSGYEEMGSDRLYITNWHSDSTTSLVWGDFAARKIRFNESVGINMHPNYHALSINSPINAGVISLYGVGNGYDYSALYLNAALTDTNYYTLSHTMNDEFYLGYREDNSFFPRLVIDKIGNVGINGYAGIENMRVTDPSNAADFLLAGVGNGYDYSIIKLGSTGATPEKVYSLSHTVENKYAITYYDGNEYLPRMIISEEGTISMNTWDVATEILDVNGNGRFRGVGSAASANDLRITADGTLTTSTSDARLKENFRPLVNSLDKVLRLNGMTFSWKESASSERDAGLIAQEVEEVFPEAVFVNPNDGFYGINYSRFPALFVEAFKEQQQIINAQRSEIDNLRQRLERLEQLISEE